MIEFPDSIVLSPGHVNQLLDKEKCSYLDKININYLNFITGQHHINNNHWIAMIIDIIKGEFILLDPKQKSSSILDKSFQSWVNYYNSRKQKYVIDWKIRKIDHPLQTDHYNCGLFVIHFIKNYLNHQVKNDTITFDCSPVSLDCDRQLISSAIESYKKL